MCGCLSHTPYWGPGLQPRHVPWLEIEPATLWFTGQHSIHWATPAKAECYHLNGTCELPPHFLFIERTEGRKKRKEKRTEGTEKEVNEMMEVGRIEEKNYIRHRNFFIGRNFLATCSWKYSWYPVQAGEEEKWNQKHFSLRFLHNIIELCSTMKLTKLQIIWMGLIQGIWDV